MDRDGYDYGPIEGFCKRDNQHFDFKTSGDILAERRSSLFQVTSGEQKKHCAQSGRNLEGIHCIHFKLPWKCFSGETEENSNKRQSE